MDSYAETQALIIETAKMNLETLEMEAETARMEAETAYFELETAEILAEGQKAANDALDIYAASVSQLQSTIQSVEAALARTTEVLDEKIGLWNAITADLPADLVQALVDPEGRTTPSSTEIPNLHPDIIQLRLDIMKTRKMATELTVQKTVLDAKLTAAQAQYKTTEAKLMTKS